MADMRVAPDPRILVEVALVQLTHDEAGEDAVAAAARLVQFGADDVGTPFGLGRVVVEESAP